MFPSHDLGGETQGVTILDAVMARGEEAEAQSAEIERLRRGLVRTSTYLAFVSPDIKKAKKTIKEALEEK